MRPHRQDGMHAERGLCYKSTPIIVLGPCIYIILLLTFLSQSWTAASSHWHGEKWTIRDLGQACVKVSCPRVIKITENFPTKSWPTLISKCLGGHFSPQLPNYLSWFCSYILYHINITPTVRLIPYTVRVPYNLLNSWDVQQVTTSIGTALLKSQIASFCLAFNSQDTAMPTQSQLPSQLMTCSLRVIWPINRWLCWS